MNANASLPWGLKPTGLIGPQDRAAGVTVERVHGASVLTVAPFRGQSARCAALLAEHFGLDWPEAGRAATDGQRMVAWNGINDVLLIDFSGQMSHAQVKAIFAGCAGVVDQSDGRFLIRIHGPSADRALAKLVEIDLHPDRFQPLMAAITDMHHISAGLIKVSGDPSYILHCARSYAADFWHHVATAGAEYTVSMKV